MTEIFHIWPSLVHPCSVCSLLWELDWGQCTGCSSLLSSALSPQKPNISWSCYSFLKNILSFFMAWPSWEKQICFCPCWWEKVLWVLRWGKAAFPWMKSPWMWSWAEDSQDSQVRCSRTALIWSQEHLKMLNSAKTEHKIPPARSFRRITVWGIVWWIWINWETSEILPGLEALPSAGFPLLGKWGFV